MWLAVDKRLRCAGFLSFDHLRNGVAMIPQGLGERAPAAVVRGRESIGDVSELGRSGGGIASFEKTAAADRAADEKHLRGGGKQHSGFEGLDQHEEFCCIRMDAPMRERHNMSI